jgi:hypothetical protein
VKEWLPERATGKLGVEAPDLFGRWIEDGVVMVWASVKAASRFLP